MKFKYFYYEKYPIQFGYNGWKTNILNIKIGNTIKCCLFSFDCDDDNQNRICILKKDGLLLWTQLSDLDVPENLLYKHSRDLKRVGKSWFLNYNGTY